MSIGKDIRMGKTSNQETISLGDKPISLDEYLPMQPSLRFWVIVTDAVSDNQPCATFVPSWRVAQRVVQQAESFLMLTQATLFENAASRSPASILEVCSEQ
jgi:hypothetical protein